MLLVLDVSSSQPDDKHQGYTDLLHPICDVRFSGPSGVLVFVFFFCSYLFASACLPVLGACLPALGACLPALLPWVPADVKI